VPKVSQPIVRVPGLRRPDEIWDRRRQAYLFNVQKHRLCVRFAWRTLGVSGDLRNPRVSIVPGAPEENWRAASPVCCGRGCVYGGAVGLR
jgi:hypothetical protein